MEKTAFVTGGSRGIGRAVVRRLAVEGYAVGINYLQSRAAAEDLAAEIRVQGGRALAVQADVADRAAVRAAIEQAVEAVKTDEEMEGTYMTLAMKLQDMKWEGRQEGRQEGEESKLFANLKALMENLDIPADKAMDLLNVPASDRPKYRKMLDE